MKEILGFSRIEDIRSILFLIGLIFIGIIIEIFSLSLISPTVSLVLGQSKNFELFNGLLLINSIDSKNVLALLLLIFLIKFSYFGGLSFYQNRVLTNFIEHISSSLFKRFITESYRDRIERTSGDIVNIIQNEVTRFYTYLYDTMVLVIEIIFSIAIVGTLLYFNLFVTLYIIVIGFIFGITYKSFFGKRLKYYGEKRQDLEFLTTNKIIESVSLFKEIKIFNKEQPFYLDYKIVNEKRYFFASRYMTLNQFSRYFIEIVFIIILVTSLGYSLLKEIDLQGQIPSISLFLAASLRIIPSMNRIISSYQTRKYLYPSVKIIGDNWLETGLENSNDINTIKDFKSYILFDNINFSFGDSKKLFKNFSFKIKKNETHILTGKSGIGKSTLFDIILGFIQLNDQKIIIDDKEINRNEMDPSFFGFVPQKIYLLNENIYKNIAFGVNEKNIDKNRIDKYLNYIGLEEFVGSNSRKLGEGGMKVSGGQKQKIGILRAIYFDCKIILLDESLANLDMKSKIEILNFIKSYDSTFIIISHDFDIINQFENIYKI